MKLDLLSSEVLEITQHESYLYHLTPLGIDITDTATWTKHAFLAQYQISSFLVCPFGLYFGTDLGLYYISLASLALGGDLENKVNLVTSFNFIGTAIIKLKYKQNSLLVITDEAVNFIPTLVNPVVYICLGEGFTDGDIAAEENRLVLFKAGLYHMIMPSANWTLAEMIKIEDITALGYKKLSNNLLSSYGDYGAVYMDIRNKYILAITNPNTIYMKFLSIEAGSLVEKGVLLNGEHTLDRFGYPRIFNILGNTLTFCHYYENKYLSCYTIAETSLILKYSMQNGAQIYLALVTEDKYIHRNYGGSTYTAEILSPTTTSSTFYTTTLSSGSYSVRTASGPCPVNTDIIVLGLNVANSIHSLNILKYNYTLHAFERQATLTAPNICPGKPVRMEWENNYLYVQCISTTTLLVVYKLVGNTLILVAELPCPSGRVVLDSANSLSVANGLIALSYNDNIIVYTMFYFNYDEEVFYNVSSNILTEYGSAKIMLGAVDANTIYVTIQYGSTALPISGLYEIWVSPISGLHINKLIAGPDIYLATDEGLGYYSYIGVGQTGYKHKLVSSDFNYKAIKDIQLLKNSSKNRGSLIYGTNTANSGKFGIIDLGKV